MGKKTGFVAGFVCACFVLTATAFAQENSTPPAPVKKGMRPSIAEKCPQCAGIEAKMQAKRAEIKVINDKIRELRATEKGKEVPPPAAKDQTKKPMLSKEERMTQMKSKDPAMYDLMVQKDKVAAEMKPIREELMNCRKACLGQNKPATAPAASTAK